MMMMMEEGKRQGEETRRVIIYKNVRRGRLCITMNDKDVVRGGHLCA